MGMRYHDALFFNEVTKEEACQEIINLDGSEATMCGNIPADILKASVNIDLGFLTDIIYKSFGDGEFQVY